MTAKTEAGEAFEILVYVTPRFNLAATVWFLDPFRAANYLEGRPLFQWTLISAQGGEVAASNGMTVTSQALSSSPPSRPSLAVVSASWTPEAYVGPPLVPALRHWARGGVPLVGLDTGGFLLAEAGLLKGRRATVHYEHIDAFAELYPEVEVSEELYVMDGDRLTCCGGAAAADLALQVLRASGGEALANAAARYVFHDRLRAPGDPQNPTRAEPLGSTVPAKLKAAIMLMETRREEAASIAEIAGGVGLSQRQLERLFATYVGASPVQYYRDIRLDRARGLVTQTELPLYQIAVACGFASPEHFSRAYRERFGLAPSRDRVSKQI